MAKQKPQPKTTAPAEPVGYPAVTTLDKIKAVQPFSQKIGEFLDWLREQGIELAIRHSHTDDCYSMNMSPEEFRAYADDKITKGEWVWYADRKPFETRTMIKRDEYGAGKFVCPKCGCRDDDLMPLYKSTDSLLHQYFGIDPKQEEAERRAVLDFVRKQNT